MPVLSNLDACFDSSSAKLVWLSSFCSCEGGFASAGAKSSLPVQVSVSTKYINSLHNITQNLDLRVV